MSNPDPKHGGSLVRRGTVLDGRYEVVRYLDSGGFAEVYEGRQVNIDRAVAIKVLNGGDGNSDKAVQFRKRFFQEARLAAKVQHPGAITIIDYGVTALGMPYMVLELLTGKPLDRVLAKQGRFGVGRAILLMVRCLDALAVAHSSGVVHRDLKPSNLFVVECGTRRERLCILDFGLAFAVEETSRLTDKGSVNGTPRYLAPEYIQNQTVSPAMDVYQMGLTLIEMLTGIPVVNEDNAYRCLIQHCTGTLELPKSLLQSPLGPVVQRALALDHTDRYPNGGDFRDALEAVIPQLGIPMTPADSAELALLDIDFGTEAVSLSATPDVSFRPSQDSALSLLSHSASAEGWDPEALMAAGLSPDQLSGVPDLPLSGEDPSPLAASADVDDVDPVERQSSNTFRRVLKGLAVALERTDDEGDASEDTDLQPGGV